MIHFSCWFYEWLWTFLEYVDLKVTKCQIHNITNILFEQNFYVSKSQTSNHIMLLQFLSSNLYQQVFFKFIDFKFSNPNFSPINHCGLVHNYHCNSASMIRCIWDYFDMEIVLVNIFSYKKPYYYYIKSSKKQDLALVICR